MSDTPISVGSALLYADNNMGRVNEPIESKHVQHLKLTRNNEGSIEKMFNSLQKRKYSYSFLLIDWLDATHLDVALDKTKLLCL